MNSRLHVVRAAAADVFGIPEGEVSAESSPESIPQWDSLKQLYLIMALEERFGIELDPSEIETVTTIGSIADVLERRLGPG